MKGYWVVLVYPVVPAVAGVLMGTYPLVLVAALVAAGIAWLWKARRRPVLDLLVGTLPTEGFSRPVSGLVVTALFVQAVASFLLGMGIVASWNIAWLLPYATIPSSVLAITSYLKHRSAS